MVVAQGVSARGSLGVIAMAKKKGAQPSQQGGPKVTVVKRKGKLQAFDGRKLFASVYHACRDVHMEEEAAEVLAEKVLARVEAGIAGKEKVDSMELFQMVIRELSSLNGEAGYRYEHPPDA